MSVFYLILGPSASEMFDHRGHEEKRPPGGRFQLKRAFQPPESHWIMGTTMASAARETMTAVNRL